MDNEPIQPERKKRGRGRPSVDLRGRQYGWLVPLEPKPREGKGQTMWKCLCTASHQAQPGKPRVVDIRYSALEGGSQRSCGCRQRTVRSELDVGRRPKWVECELTRNEFLAYGVSPAPTWARSTDVEAEQARKRDQILNDMDRINEELGIPDFDKLKDTN